MVVVVVVEGVGVEGEAAGAVGVAAGEATGAVGIVAGEATGAVGEATGAAGAATAVAVAAAAAAVTVLVVAGATGDFVDFAVDSKCPSRLDDHGKDSTCSKSICRQPGSKPLALSLGGPYSQRSTSNRIILHINNLKKKYKEKKKLTAAIDTLFAVPTFVFISLLIP